MDVIRRILSKIFKRGKKDKQEQEKPAAAQQSPSSSQKPPAAPPKDVPPQQQQQSSSGEPDSTSKSPLTHPLVTGQHDEPQEAVPQEKQAQLGLTSARNPDKAGRPAAAQDMKPREEQRGVSPTKPSAAGGDTDNSEPVSAVENEDEHPPTVPPKSDVAPGAQPKPGQIEPPTEAGVKPFTAAAEPTQHTTTTMEKHNPAAGSEATENLQPNGTAAEHEEPVQAMSHTATAPADQSTTQDQTEQLKGLVVSDDKIPVMSEEPPPIKEVQAAPGMSATSGPLEDFPDGGDHFE